MNVPIPSVYHPAGTLVNEDELDALDESKD